MLALNEEHFTERNEEARAIGVDDMMARATAHR
jgi:hypothetical protein